MKDYWLTPNGQLLEVPDSGHDRYASDLLEKEVGKLNVLDYVEEQGCDYPYEVLHKRGWVRIKSNPYLPKIEILGGCVSLIKQMKNTMDPPMNPTQMRVAKQLCEENNVLFHEAINDKRFW